MLPVYYYSLDKVIKRACDVFFAYISKAYPLRYAIACLEDTSVSGAFTVTFLGENAFTVT